MVPILTKDSYFYGELTSQRIDESQYVYVGIGFQFNFTDGYVFIELFINR